jgi:hypothetical protein
MFVVPGLVAGSGMSDAVLVGAPAFRPVRQVPVPGWLDDQGCEQTGDPGTLFAGSALRTAVALVGEPHDPDRVPPAQPTSRRRACGSAASGALGGWVARSASSTAMPHDHKVPLAGTPQRVSW